MKRTGLVIVDISKGANWDDIRRLALKAISMVPEGRMIALIYVLPKQWGGSIPTESIFLETIMGKPSARVGEPAWIFFGSVFVRACSVRGNRRVTKDEYGVLLLRRCGPKPYERRHVASRALLRKAEMQTLHPVFTRDVANNVWHIPANDAVRRIVQRLGALVAWPDEEIAILRVRSTRFLKNEPLFLDDDLIGIPQKVSESK